MMKLVLGRVLPMAVAVGLFTSALSPLRPALAAFGVAADALGGETHGGGVQTLDSGQVPLNSEGGLASLFGSLFGPREKGQNAKEQIQGLVESLKAKSEANGKAPAKPAVKTPARPGGAKSPGPAKGK